jgi:hypothetical protein
MLVSIHLKLQIIEISIFNSTSNLKGGVAGEKEGPSPRRQNRPHQKGVEKIKFSHKLWLLPGV